MVRIHLAVYILIIFASVARGDMVHGRVDGTLGGGASNLNAVSPSSSFKINPGAFFTLQGEKPFGSLPLYLVGSINYIRSSGTLNYNYLSPTSITYVQNGVNYTFDEIQANLGLALKFFDNSNFRPYLAGGGSGGFLQLTYDNSLRTPAVLGAGNDFAMIDNALDFGIYGEAGLEVQLTPSFGARIAFRYLDAYSRPVATMNNQIIHYDDIIYYGGLLIHF